MSHDDQSWMHIALQGLNETLESKNDDYRIDGEFSNFEFAADIAGISVVESITNQLAIKLGRIKGIRDSGKVNNEAILDSYKDLAGYAVILYAYELSKQEDRSDTCAHVSFNEHIVSGVSGGLTEYIRKCDDCSKYWTVTR